MIDPQTIERLLTLPAAERLTIAEALWDSLAAEPAVTLAPPDWHRPLVEARLREDDADTTPGETWAEVRARIERGT